MRATAPRSAAQAVSFLRFPSRRSGLGAKQTLARSGWALLPTNLPGTRQALVGNLQDNLQATAEHGSTLVNCMAAQTCRPLGLSLRAVMQASAHLRLAGCAISCL